MIKDKLKPYDYYLSKIVSAANIRSISKQYGAGLLQHVNKNYILDEYIDIGGESIVLKAIHSDLGSRRAVKAALPFFNKPGKRTTVVMPVITKFFFHDESSYRDRFIRGIRLQSELSESINQDNGYIPYVINISKRPLWADMKFYDAYTLIEWTEDRDIKEILLLLRRLAKLLEQIHRQRSIHRDIKCKNILVAHDNKPVLVDFSSAKNIYNKSDDLTQIGFPAGTPSYAPENMLNDFGSCRERDDIYCFARVLWCAINRTYPRLEGVNPNDATKRPKKIIAAQKEFYRLDRLPEALHKVFIKCTKDRPEERYQFFDEFLEDYNLALDEMLITEEVEDMPRQSGRFKKTEEYIELLQKMSDEDILQSIPDSKFKNLIWIQYKIHKEIHRLKDRGLL